MSAALSPLNLPSSTLIATTSITVALVFVHVFIPFVLLLQNVVETAPIVDSGIRPVVCPEVLCHVVNGGTDCSFSQGIERVMREAGFSHGLGEGAEEECSTPFVVEILEVWVVVVLDFIEEHNPSFPTSSFVVLCLTCRALSTGRLASSEETHETIFDGSPTILKLSGICEVNCVFNRERR